MSSLFSGLNEPQLSAVQTLGGPMLVLAGAGTGKTKVITCRIANLVRCDVPPESIVALTFTNKAAREMRERVSHLIGDRAKSIFIGTFHSYCLAMLKKDPVAFGLGPRFSLVVTSDQIDLVRRAIEEKGWQAIFHPRDALFRISKLKNSTLSPKLTGLLTELVGSGQGEEDVMIHELASIYDRQLRVNAAIDFDDCIVRVVRTFAKNEELRKAYASKVRFLMVDEYQDTNFLQLDLIQQIGIDTRNVCVVGDDDQSIYSWRGAVTRNIEMFEAVFPGTKMIKLEQNYRCTTPILDAANSVIVNNLFRKGKSLWSTKKSEQPVSVVSYSDDLVEASTIARKIMAEKGRGRKYSDIAILYRMNAMARNFEQALRAMDVPYKVFGGQSFFERKEVRDFLGYVKVAVNPHDRMSLLRIINTPNRGIGLKTLEKISQVAEKNSCSMFTAMTQHGSEFAGSAKKSIDGFVATCQQLFQIKPRTTGEVEALGNHIIRVSGLDRDIRAKHSDAGSQQKKMQLLRSLPSWLSATSKSMGFGSDKDELSEILDELLLDSADRDEDDLERDQVSLMTIHSAKGLEFTSVYVVGAEDDILPHQNSVNEGKVDEERRLFYVALTRAKENLEVSFCDERTIASELRPKIQSRFIKEIDANVVRNSTGKESIKQSVDERKQQTMSKLSNFRQSLRGADLK